MSTTPEVFERIINVSKLLVTFQNMSLLLIRFIKNPDTVINNLANSNDENIASIFSNIAKGIKGEFTRGKAIEYGKQNIINLITKIAIDIEKEYTPITEHIKILYKTLEDNVSIVENTTNTKVLLARKELYNYDIMSKEFLVRRAIAFIGTSLLLHNDKYNGLSTYLAKLPMLLDNNDMINYQELTDLKTNYKNHKVVINSDYKNINIVRKDVTVPTELELPTTEVTIVSDDTLLEMLNKTELDIPDVYPTELLDNLINMLPNTIAKIGNEIDVLNVGIHDFNPNDNFITYLKNMVNNCTDYANLIITENEFIIRNNNYLDILTRCNTLDYELTKYIGSIVNKINNNINIYLAVYAAIDKITLNGTIEIVKVRKEK
jgi:hypothetical protein